MTLVSDIITAAYREGNLIPIGTTPNANQAAEGLTRLNSIVLSSVGNEVGEELRDLNYGGDYTEEDATTEYLPANARLILNLAGAVTLYLDPGPYEGQRLAVADALDNLATYNLVLDGNGRTIEDAATLTLSTNGLTRQWMYRSDTANWVKITSLLSSDTMPLPEEFDDYFTMMLAMRLNPMYGQEMAPETVNSLRRGKRNIAARYRNKKETRPEYMGRLGADSYYSYYSDFRRGRY